MRFILYGLLLALGWVLGAFVGGADITFATAPSARAIVDPEITQSRVRVTPDGFRIVNHGCSAADVTRQRQIDLAVSQWARFGFRVLRFSTDDGAFHEVAQRDLQRADIPEIVAQLHRSQRQLLESDDEVYGAIAAYWSVIDPPPDAMGLPREESRLWRAQDDPPSISDAPWSAAFISWLMCESGLDADAFPRKSSHWRMIEALAEETAAPAFTEDLDVGAAQPGDLVCYCRDCLRYSPGPQPMHCDFVIGRTPATLLLVGGNVRDSVALQLVPIDYLSVNPERYVRLRSSLPAENDLSAAFAIPSRR